ncbi:hypothetical protein BDV96DRAFT_653604 [Lophiotrema nucula]|uniref:Uncharacterized protein n=1 Tax=Lophiotrema nucula TaxID=690887 RepID=A0A6A5YMQ6_9PLEO|nr:hypothetical protein BDV96DRAFT_653604 [Lophiotrema nucula]
MNMITPDTTTSIFFSFLFLFLSPANSIFVEVTPHDKFSSNGALGCKININRIAYWPMYPDCNNMCVRITAQATGYSVYVLHTDQSVAAHDISYDAWNFLGTGKSAKDDPRTGGAIKADYEFVPMENCHDILAQGTLPIMASSPNFYFGCPSSSWVGQHSTFWNIWDQQCTLGVDEECQFDPGMNQATCPTNQLTGVGTRPLIGMQIYDIPYKDTAPALNLPDTGTPNVLVTRAVEVSTRV